MDIEKLQSFITLANTRHFTKAADQLYISQPALSKQIQALEAQLQVPLFDRVGKQTFLTVQGQHFKRYAEDILSTYLNAREHIRQIEHLKTGTLNFGATNFIGVYLMPRIIAAFHEKYPQIEIKMTIQSSRSILNLLHKNYLEFIFLSDYIIEDHKDYVVKDYMTDHLSLIVGSGHPLFGERSCSLFDLEDELFIVKRANSSQDQFLSREFSRVGFQMKNRLFISHQEAIKESVIHNIGVSFMSDTAVERERAYGLLQTLSLKELTLSRRIQYVYERSRHLTPAAKAFLCLLP